MDEERVIELRLGVTPEAAISGAVLVQTGADILHKRWGASLHFP
jgi:hypothetical protein